MTPSFRGFSPWPLGSIVSEPVVKQNVMVGIMWWSKTAHLTVPGRKGEERRGEEGRGGKREEEKRKKKRKREKKKSGSQYPLQGHTPRPRTSSNRPLLLKAPLPPNTTTG